MTTTATIYTRPGETILKVLSPFAGICTLSGKPTTSAHAAWIDRPDSRFPVARHSDGSQCFYQTHVPDPQYQDVSFNDRKSLPLCPDCQKPFTQGLIEKTEERSSCFLKPICPDCGAIDQFNRRDTGYGWDVTCTACGQSHYYDSGD